MSLRKRPKYRSVLRYIFRNIIIKKGSNFLYFSSSSDPCAGLQLFNPSFSPFLFQRLLCLPQHDISWNWHSQWVPIHFHWRMGKHLQITCPFPLHSNWCCISNVAWGSTERCQKVVGFSSSIFFTDAFWPKLFTFIPSDYSSFKYKRTSPTL